MPKQKQQISLSQAMDGFLIACHARKLSKHTIADYERTIKKFIRHVGDTPMAEITTNQISAFLASQPWSEKTVLNYHIGLSAWWTWAIREGYLTNHIVRIVQKPRPKKLVIEPFSEIEVRALLLETRTHKDRDKAIIYLLLDTGIRASELVGLERDRIDLENHKIKVLGKGNRERLLPFSPKTGQMLFRHLSNSGGKPFPIGRTSLTSLFDRLGRRAGVPNCHPHRFRHTFAITYLRNGGDAFTLQEMLDHSTMEMVKRYLAIAQVDVDRAHRKASPIENWNL
jgi:site-specific recombinase XerD